MRGERFVALGLAHARAAWFSELAQWSTSGMIPVEFVKCVTIDEIRSHLATGRPFSAMMLDGSLPGVDRDLLDEARARGCAVVIVDDGRVRRDWTALGASAVLPSTFARVDLLDALETHSSTISRADVAPIDTRTSQSYGPWRGRLLGVIGAGGTGVSTAAVALSQGFGRDVRFAGLVLLADLALDADQAVLHDTGDVIPGIQELVDAHRIGTPGAGEVRSLAFDVPDRQYHLLLGLRRHRDWAAIRPRAFEAALDSMRQSYRAVIADIDVDLEGEAQCGSIDVEERNLFARCVVRQSDVVIVVGLPGPKGVHRLVRVVDALAEHGVDPARVLPVVNRAPRNPRARAELTAAYTELVRPAIADRPPVAGPVFLPERKHLDDLVSSGRRLPAALVAPLTGAVRAVIDRLPSSEPDQAITADVEPMPVAPGSLGSWSDDGLS